MKSPNLKLVSLMFLTGITVWGGIPLLHSFSRPALAQTTAQKESDRLFKLGIQQYQTRQITGAIRSLQQALKIYQQTSDRRGETETLLFLGLSYTSLKQYDSAIAYSEQALARFRELRDIQGEALALMNLGNAYNALSQYAKAISYYQQTLPIYQRLGDREGRAIALMNLGNAHNEQSQYTAAIPYLEQAIPLFRAVQNTGGEAISFYDLGNAYFSLAKYSKAISYYQQALPLFQTTKNQASEADVLNRLGVAYDSLSQYPEAIRYFEQALSIYQALQNREGEAKMLGNLGNAYRALSQYAQAIAYTKQAIPVFRALKDPNSEATALTNLGNIHISLSQTSQAITYYEQSLPIFRELGDRAGEANTLNNLAVVYVSQAQFPKAIAYLEQALLIYQATQNREGEASVYAIWGNAYLIQAQYSKAITYYEQALPIFRQVGDRNREGYVLDNLGTTFSFLRQYEKAMSYYKQSLPILRAVSDRNGEAISLSNLGRMLLAMEQPTQAEPFLRQAIQLRECLRVGLTDDQKVSIFEDQKDAYQSLQQVLIAQNKPAEALEIAERGRARAFVELLAQRLNPLPNASDVCTPVQPPNLVQIQQIAKQQNATLVEYSVIGRDRLFIWVVQPNGKLHFREVELKASLKGIALAEWVKMTRYEDLNVRGRGIGLVESPAETQNAELLDKANLNTLHQWLIEPIAELLPQQADQRIIFIPHDALFLVPFAALRDAEGRYLIEKHTIATAPSIQTLALTRKQKQAIASRSKGGAALIVGNPVMPEVTVIAGEKPVQLAALPGAKAEAQALATLFKTSALLGAQATEATVKAQMPKASLIHLATHGLFDDDRGLESALALTPTDTEDGFLTAAEMSDLSLQAKLVVLSACDTGRGKITGDGVIGLSRSLISAGVPSVIVSLWAVPDAPTAFLMTEFYKNRESTGDHAKALRQAMLTTLQRYPKPRDWAAFALIGES
ncbi:MAG TPA: tetratricopeptide repeat protein [Leptolyngbyaceae cyanobacterium M33_DOE_097]|uniref:Tetratricopeptide repeat protein n=1 Tax=Oscillatoriales cyanobacterium SpSt-418 TaxID=2282169 RepID=A0A7C3KHI5_9CYAN|nr:tetratricopeptide repeat protein [Leptolyngbyaceae cyanobacterium M33_DOE_097]